MKKNRDFRNIMTWQKLQKMEPGITIKNALSHVQAVFAGFRKSLQGRIMLEVV